MIQPFQPKQTTSNFRLNESAQKVFDEATGAGGDLFVPEVEDRYEDLAANFLEQWLVTSNDSSTSIDPYAAPETRQPKQPVQHKPATPPASLQLEPEMTTFSLSMDWKLSDGRKLT